MVVLAAGELAASISACRGVVETTVAWFLGKVTTLRVCLGASSWELDCGGGDEGGGCNRCGGKGNWKSILGIKDKKFGRECLGGCCSVSLLIVEGTEISMGIKIKPWRVYIERKPGLDRWESVGANSILDCGFRLLQQPYNITSPLLRLLSLSLI